MLVNKLGKSDGEEVLRKDLLCSRVRTAPISENR